MTASAYIAIAIIGTLVIVAITVPIGYHLLKRGVREGIKDAKQDTSE